MDFTRKKGSTMIAPRLHINAQRTCLPNLSQYDEHTLSLVPTHILLEHYGALQKLIDARQVQYHELIIGLNLADQQLSDFMAFLNEEEAELQCLEYKKKQACIPTDYYLLQQRVIQASEEMADFQAQARQLYQHREEVKDKIDKLSKAQTTLMQNYQDICQRLTKRAFPLPMDYNAIAARYCYNSPTATPRENSECSQPHLFHHTNHQCENIEYTAPSRTVSLR